MYEFYGGKVNQIAAVETPEDSYTNRDGNQRKKREHYPDAPAVSVETCRTLAERIIDAEQYEDAFELLRNHNREAMRVHVNTFLAPYIQQMDNLELTRVYEKRLEVLERRVA